MALVIHPGRARLGAAGRATNSFSVNIGGGATPSPTPTPTSPASPSASYDSSIPAGGTATVGFTASYSGSNGAPATVSCN